MNKKSALELSVNFMVVIIIALVLFSFGIKFIYDIYNKSTLLKDMTLGDIDEQIADIICGNTQQICIGEDTIYLEPKQHEILSVRLMNILNSKIDFNVVLERDIYRFYI